MTHSNQFIFIARTLNNVKMLQELNEEYLLNLLDRLSFEMEIRTLVISDDAAGGGWFQPMYLNPMWNIVEKIKAFKPYFDEIGIVFPFESVYRQPINFATLFDSSVIQSKQEELIFNGEIVIVQYNYI